MALGSEQELTMPIRVGTCGWQYDDWRTAFYPADVPKKRWLATYAGAFDTVECDNAFYRLPAREVFERWRDEVPEGFTMAVKASRFLTHIKRLKEPEEPVGRLLEATTGLGDRLGPILLQLPPSLSIDLDRLDACLRCFPASVRVAVETRHGSWWIDETRSLLTERAAASVWSDRLSIAIAPDWRTTDWAYLRLHQGRLRFPPTYPTSTLRFWRKRLQETWSERDDMFVYLNNDPGAAAVLDAKRFRGGDRG